MQLNLDSEQIQQGLEIIGTLGSGFVAFGALWWKFSKWINNKEVFQARADEQLGRLAEAHLKLTEALTIMTVRLEEREKDLMKLEGALDIQRKDMVGVITALQKTSGSLDVLWRTMQSVYPDQVPRRLSDKI